LGVGATIRHLDSGDEVDGTGRGILGSLPVRFELEELLVILQVTQVPHLVTASSIGIWMY
jgi:hypothetical protein